MNIPSSEEKNARLRREGMVDALVDCLALLEQDRLPRAIQARVAEAAGTAGESTRIGALTREAVRVGEGALDSYLACQRWIAQGLGRESLAARILQRIFTIWPREAADYQLRYDEFLEKELENPRATYYLSSHEWMAAVEDLRDEVLRARELNQPHGARTIRRCLKLLLTHPPQPAAAALPPPGTVPGDTIVAAHQPRLIK